MGSKLRFIADWLKFYTIYLTFLMFVIIIQQTETIKGLIAAVMFIVLMACSLQQHEDYDREFKAENI